MTTYLARPSATIHVNRLLSECTAHFVRTTTSRILLASKMFDFLDKWGNHACLVPTEASGSNLHILLQHVFLKVMWGLLLHAKAKVKAWCCLKVIWGLLLHAKAKVKQVASPPFWTRGLPTVCPSLSLLSATSRWPPR